MENYNKYKSVFIETFSIEEASFNDEVKYNEITSWDSIGHMTLISELEDKFGIMIDSEDVINFSSFKKGMEILGKYGLSFN